LAFLDIETTSLFADTGMLVCAVLRKEQENRVFFVDSPRREKTVLDRLLRATRKCDNLVTFNGRSFDIPFLISRALVLNLEDPHLLPATHIDLYERCKMLLRFDRLSLDHVTSVLDIDNPSDISGREVPHLYISYLATRDRKLRDRIIEHCTSDVEALEKIMSRLETLLPKEGLER